MKEIYAQVMDINEKFYSVFSSGDFRNMQDLWSKSVEVSVIHPGMPAIHGYTEVMQSWKQILGSSGSMDIHCRNSRAYLYDNFAYVLCNELVSGTRLVATNIYSRQSGKWLMVHHHAATEHTMSRVQTVPEGHLH